MMEAGSPHTPPTGPSSLVIRLLGPFEARVAGAPLPRLHSRKGHWLLGLLVLRHGRSVERAWLAGTLWPESPEPLALYNLRRELTLLRQALGPEAWRLQSPVPHSLKLDVGGADVDVSVFDAAVAGGDETALRQAVDLYRGPLLEGCAEEWAAPERTTRAEQYLQVLETLAERALGRGDLSAAICDLRRAVGADPLRESAYRALIGALAARGDFPAALQTYRDLRLLLHRELNAEPSAETRALFDRLRAESRSRAGADAPPPAARPAPSLPRPNLPRPLTRLIGRDAETREVVQLVRSSRLVTLTGTGGVGKSRLALRAAEEVADELPDGVWLVELAALADPALLPETVAAALGAREAPGRSLPETIASFLRSRQGLLLLDNCEHLLDACASFTERILRSCPEVHLLVTSRQSLGLFGEVTWRVPSLPFPEPGDLPAAGGDLAERVLDFAAVQLFAERARQAQPGFEVTPQNARAVAQIGARLDGIPLALELAAARVKALPVEEIALRLDQRLLLSSGGSRAALPRHRTLQATMDWSYDLLTEDERVLLRRLSVFAGGWTLEAAESVCGGEAEVFGYSGYPRSGGFPIPEYPNTRIPEYLNTEDVIDLLAQLVDRSLVVFEERDGAPRYRLLETVRRYALARLQESGEAGRARDRHLAYYCRLCEEAEPHLFGPVADPLWISRIGREIDNIRAAFEWSERDAPAGEPAARSEAALRMAAAVHWQWFHLGTLKEARERLTAVLQQRRPGLPHARARALTASGVAAFWQGDYPAMRAPLEESLPIFREVGDIPGTAYTLCVLAGATCLAGEPEQARRHGEEALELAGRLRDPVLVPFAFWWLAFAAQCQEDLVAARAYSERGTAAARETGSRAGVAHHTCLLGIINAGLGDYPAARRFFAESLELLHAMGDQWGTLRVLQGLAGVAAAEGQPARAARLLGASEALRDRIGASIPPNEHEQHTATVAAVRAALDAGFTAAWEEGRAMTLERAVHAALEC